MASGAASRIVFNPLYDGSEWGSGGFAPAPNYTLGGSIFHTLPAPIGSSHHTSDDTGPGSAYELTLVTASGDAPPADDLFDAQWHFGYLGDIQKIWEEFTGSGVHVGIYDDGVQYSHPDLDDHYDIDSQLSVELFGQQWYLDAAEFPSSGSPHGTSVAGLVAAARDGEGTVGVAYDSTITGVPIFGGMADINGSFEGFIAALNQADKFDIISNSWGATAAFFQSSLEQNSQINAGWLHAVKEGRVDDEGNKLGTIVVKAAGNDNLNTNGDGANTTRATIIVGAYDATGDASYYSSFGANLLISAPSSGDRFEFGSGQINDPGLVSTDLIGDAGYNMDADPSLGLAPEV